MQLLVFADTHGHPRRMLQIVRDNLSSAHAVFFLGDGAREADEIEKEFPRLPLYRVRGNCDFGDSSSTFGLVPLGGFLFFYTHGQSYGVKHGLDTLWNAAKANSADIALFAHTHVPYCKNLAGIHLFNPGSLENPRAGPPTWGRIILGGSSPVFEICEL